MSGCYEDDTVFHGWTDSSVGGMENYEISSSNCTSTGYGKLPRTISHTYLIIFFGFLSGKLKLIRGDQVKGLMSFADNFALPVLIFDGFRSIAMEEVKWTIVAGIILAKVIVFTLVVIISLSFTKPRDSRMAALFGMFATHGNHFAVGLPLLLSSNFKKSSVYVNYLYLLDPLYSVTLSPIACYTVLLHQQKTPDNNRGKPFLKLYRHVTRPSVIIAVLFGIASNMIFQKQLPDTVSHTVEAIAISHPTISLFILGRLLAVNYHSSQSCSLVVPVLLTTAKNMLLPIVISKLIELLVNDDNVVEGIGDFGFFYGILPANLSVLLLADRLGVAYNVISIGLAGSIVLSAISMFLANSMTLISTSQVASGFREHLLNTLGSASVIGIFCSLWVTTFLVIEKQRTFPMRRILFFIVISQLLTSAGGIINAFIPSKPNPLLYLQYLLSISGSVSTRIWASFMAITMAYLQWRRHHTILRFYKYIIITGVVTISSIVLSFFIQMPSFTSYKYKEDSIFPFSKQQTCVLLAAALLSLLVGLQGLIAYQHYYIKSHRLKRNDGDEMEELCLEANNMDISKSIILILAIYASTFVHVIACLWKILIEDDVGVYLEIAILDTILTYGQGVFAFLLFGLDDQLVLQPFTRMLDQLSGIES